MKKHEFNVQHDDLRNPVERLSDRVGDSNLPPPPAMPLFSAPSEGFYTRKQLFGNTPKVQHQEAPANPYPVHAYPQAIQDIIKEAATALKYPVDFIGASMLFAASVALGNTHHVQVKRGFTQNAVLYMALVGKAGTTKSHPLSFALQPIVSQDSISFAAYELANKEYKDAISAPKQAQANNTAPPPDKPVWSKTIVVDATPEALAQVHNYNKRGIALYKDEFAGWFKNFNRYSNGSEMEFWLSQWSGKPISIDRKGSDSIYIPCPYIGVVGTIQNKVLTELAKDGKNNNGFNDRLLYVIPENLQKESWSDDEMSEVALTNWHDIINNLLDIPFTGEPTILKFTPEAKTLLFRWQAENAIACNNEDDETLSGIYSKLDIHILRIALILEAMRYGCNIGSIANIGVEAMSGAIELIRYFKATATTAHNIVSGENPIALLTTNKQQLYKALPSEFATVTAYELGERFGIKKRSTATFLKDTKLFKKAGYGLYEKLM